MSSVSLKKGAEEPWTIERVAKFVETTLKSDTELAVIAFANGIEMCKAEVTVEDAVKGDTESNALIVNAVMLIRGIIRTIECHTASSTQEQNESQIQVRDLAWNAKQQCGMFHWHMLRSEPAKLEGHKKLLTGIVKKQ